MKLKTIFRLVSFLFIVASLLYSQDTLRVACVGNSITEGNAMSTKLLDAYPVALGRYLGSGYVVKNCGVSGRTMLKKGDFPIWNESLFSQAIAFNPHIVTIMLGTNDSKPQNWVYKNEFVKDYLAMIDTFKQLPTHPEIYICLPLPSFSDAFSIRDSVIDADIIPMIKQIADSANVNLIDMNTAFLDKSSLMPDGIHPLVVGSDIIARIFYKELTGNQIDSLQENNVGLNKPAFQGANVLPELTDGISATRAVFTSISSPVFINLQNQSEIDMIQIDFIDSSWSKIGFTLAVSTDSLGWTTVKDTTFIDSLLLSEKNVLKFTALFAPLNAKFIKLQINAAETPGGSVIPISEIKVLEKRTVHASLWGWKYLSETASSMRVRVDVKKISNKGEYHKIYRQSKDGDPFTLIYNYGTTQPTNFTLNITFGTTIRYYSAVYLNGMEVTSDTLAIVSQKTTEVKGRSNRWYPDGFELLQNYPNPFNPTTTIGYYLPHRSTVQLKIFDVMGRELEIIVNEEKPSGKYDVRFDSSKLSSGIYFYRINADGFTDTKKLAVMK